MQAGAKPAPLQRPALAHLPLGAERPAEPVERVVLASARRVVARVVERAVVKAKREVAVRVQPADPAREPQRLTVPCCRRLHLTRAITADSAVDFSASAVGLAQRQAQRAADRLAPQRRRRHPAVDFHALDLPGWQIRQIQRRAIQRLQRHVIDVDVHLLGRTAADAQQRWRAKAAQLLHAQAGLGVQRLWHRQMMVTQLVAGQHVRRRGRVELSGRHVRLATMHAGVGQVPGWAIGQGAGRRRQRHVHGVRGMRSQRQAKQQQQGTQRHMTPASQGPRTQSGHLLAKAAIHARDRSPDSQRGRSRLPAATAGR